MSQRVMTNVPASDVPRVVGLLEADGYTVTKSQQADGSWSITAESCEDADAGDAGPLAQAVTNPAFDGHPTLQRGDHGDEVELLQNLLNRIGALLEVDGRFGDATERAVREGQRTAAIPDSGIVGAEMWAWLEQQREPSEYLSTREVTFIAREEVGSRKYYDAFTCKPQWPGETSGITIGVGYDLSYHVAEFDPDWGPLLDSAVLARLRLLLGKKGNQDIALAHRDIVIAFPHAWTVFCARTLPKYIGQTRTIYPQLDELPEGCRGTLVSLVFNRGTSMEDTDRRREMRAIRQHLANGELAKVADEIEGMKRLWPNSTGLQARRQRESDLWRTSLRV
jgi:hypothetical protein